MRKLVLVAVVAGLLAGCGGSDSEDEGSRDDFVREIDALCKTTNPKLSEINKALVRTRDAYRAGQLSERQTFARFAELLRRAGAITRPLKAELRKVSVPKGERGFHRNLLDSIERGSANLRQQVSAAERRDSRRLSELSREGAVLNARTKGLITGHGGFRVCGRDG